MLNPQQRVVSIKPNIITGIFALSNPCTIGVSTITARNTCPALSKIFAKRSICAGVNSLLDNKNDILSCYSIALLRSVDISPHLHPSPLPYRLPGGIYSRPAAQSARPINPFLIGGNCTAALALCAALNPYILSSGYVSPLL